MVVFPGGDGLRKAIGVGEEVWMLGEDVCKVVVITRGVWGIVLIRVLLLYAVKSDLVRVL